MSTKPDTKKTNKKNNNLVYKENKDKVSRKKDITDKDEHLKKLGKKGEDAAVNYLSAKGYTILDRNWKCTYGEADIIALNDNVLTFIEVKTRHSIRLGMPEDSVNAKKRKRYECIAASYLQEKDFIDMPIRFDVVAILVISEKRALIRHHINAFGIC